MVRVNITNFLESAERELLEVGTWINVIGYLRQSKMTGKVTSTNSKHASRGDAKQRHVLVEASALWSAGAVQLDEYNASVLALQSLSEP